MKFLKYFNESATEPSLKEKLESITDMAYYLFDNDMPGDLHNFIGNCSVLFTGFLNFHGGFWRLKYPKRLYQFDIEGMLKALETEKDHKGRVFYSIEEKLKEIDKLYELSLLPRHKYTKEQIQSFIKPVLDIEIFGEKIISKSPIEFYYNSWLKKPGYSSKLYLDENLFELDFDKIAEIKDKIYDNSKKQKLLKDIETHFYRYKEIIRTKLQELNLSSKGLEFELSDNTHLNLYTYIYLTIREI